MLGLPIATVQARAGLRPRDGGIPMLRKLGVGPRMLRFDLEEVEAERAEILAYRKPRKRPRRKTPRTSSQFTLTQIAGLPDTGLVYFIQAVDGGPIKIGKADDPIRRLEAFQAGCPVLLRLLATMPGGMRSEYTLHRKFRDSRLHGEWFEPTPKLLRLIGRLS